MADNYLITGYCGKNHVTAECDRGIHAGIFGAGRYVLPVGKQFKAEYIGANTVRIYDGKLVDNGAAAGIPAGEYIDLVIPNASQGMNRNDLIVFQYSQDSSTLIETGSFVVVLGSETSGTAVDPELTQEDLLSGSATFDQMALWRVPVSTGTISAPVQLFEVSKSLDDAGTGTIVVDAISNDGVSYTATVEDLEELYNGFEITIIPNIASTTTAPTLNVNGLGAKPIRLSLSLNNSMLVQPKNNDYYAAGRPIKLLFDAKYLSSGAWRVSNKQRPSAEDLYGTVPVPSGGTGLDNVPVGSFIVGNGIEDMQVMTPEEVVEHIGAMKYKLLWENASPSSSFVKQTITVSGLADYDFALVVASHGGSIMCNDGIKHAIMDGEYGSSGLFIRVREVKITDNSVYFSNCGAFSYIGSNNIYNQEGNDFCIPHFIYGLQGLKKEGT